MADIEPTRLVFDVEAEEWPIENVTVYIESDKVENDVAEITRVFQFKPKAAGVYEIVLEGLPNKIKPESLRADLKSKAAKILEVSYDQKWVEKKDSQYDGKVKELELSITENRKAQARLNKKIAWLEKYANAVHPVNVRTVADSGENAKPVSALLMDSDALEGTQGFLQFYFEQASSMDAEMVSLVKQCSELERKLDNLRKEGSKNKTQGGQYIRIVTMLIEVLEIDKGSSIADLTLALKLIYLTWDAKWIASYDVRIAKKDEKAQLMYYGEVWNNTGEDWKRVSLALSTAKPSIGGTLPILPPATVKFRESGVNHAVEESKELALMNNNFAFQLNINPFAQTNQPAMNVLQANDNFNDDFNTGVEATGGSAIFSIKRIATIASDSKPHKQIIAAIELIPAFSYAISPRLKPFVYLKCATTNTSEYPFIGGPMAVFIDGSYIAMSVMGSVGVGELFSFFLGIDETVKLDYQPEKRVDDSSSVGIIRTKNMLSRTLSRKIKITNTRDEEARCVVYEQLPVSKDNKIKVTLLDPDLKKKPSKGVTWKLNPNGILEARNVIPPKQEWKFDFTYVIEWPQGQDISIDSLSSPQATNGANPMDAPAAQITQQAFQHQEMAAFEQNRKLRRNLAVQKNSMEMNWGVY